LILGGNDPVALDRAVCQTLSIEPLELLTNAAAFKAGLSDGPAEIRGELPRVSGFELPAIGTLVFGPSWTHSLSRKHLLQRPVTEKTLCKACGDCLRYCPPQAIAQQGKEIRFDYDRCIRCYCCVEVCPHGALRTEEPMLGKVFRRLIQKSSS
jgi:ferredoxin